MLSRSTTGWILWKIGPYPRDLDLERQLDKMALLEPRQKELSLRFEGILKYP